MLFHWGFAKSSSKVMEFTLMFGAQSHCKAHHFGLKRVSVNQTNVTAVMGHL